MRSKLVFISDTHGEHENIKNIPDGDIIIHCGDFTRLGRPEEIKKFFKWFVALPHEHKIVVPGNHELTLCGDKMLSLVGMVIKKHECSEKLKEMFRDFMIAKSIIKYYSNKVHVLMDSGVTLRGVKFYGSHYCNGEYHIMSNWAFYKSDEQLKSLFGKIPHDTKVLITHVPPYGVLDRKLGSKELLLAVNRVKPLVHAFGHIHQAGGRKVTNGRTLFFNCSVAGGRDPIIYNI